MRLLCSLILIGILCLACLGCVFLGPIPSLPSRDLLPGILSHSRLGKRRRMIEIIPFRDEIDLLEVRRKEHTFSDNIIVIDGNVSWSNKDKPFSLKQRLAQCSWDTSTIIPVEVDLRTIRDTGTNIQKHTRWLQQNMPLQMQNELDLADDDLVFISDLDELLDADLTNEVLFLPDDHFPVHISQSLFYYSLDCYHTHEAWAAGERLAIYTVKQLNENPLPRAASKMSNGWHLSYFFMSPEQLKYKVANLNDSLHSSEVRAAQHFDSKKIEKLASACQDLYGRTSSAHKMSSPPKDFKFPIQQVLIQEKTRACLEA